MQEKNKLIEDNIPLVYYTVQHYYPNCVHDEDIIQCGMLGLCKAAQKWDEEKGKWSTFAITCIRNDIRHEFARRAKHKDVLSLDYTLTGEDGETTWLETLSYDDGEDMSVNESWNSFFNSLSPVERDIIKGYYDGRTASSIGEDLGMSSATVNQHKRKIMRKWRAYNGQDFNQIPRRHRPDRDD